MDDVLKDRRKEKLAEKRTLDLNDKMGLTGKIKCCIIVKKKLFNSDTRSNCEEIKVEA